VKAVTKAVGTVAQIAGSDRHRHPPASAFVASAALGVVGSLLGPSPPSSGGGAASPALAVTTGQLERVAPSGGNGMGLALAAAAAFFLLR